MTRAGRFDRRLKIYDIVETRDSFGELTSEETLLVELWADVVAVKANERYLGPEQRQFSARIFKFTIRYWPGLHEKMVLELDDGKRFDIVGIAEMGKRDVELIEILGEERI